MESNPKATVTTPVEDGISANSKVKRPGLKKTVSVPVEDGISANSKIEISTPRSYKEKR